MKRLLLSLLIAAAAVPAMAKDLGVHGNTWTILELDIRKLIAESAARADWTEARQQLDEAVKAYPDGLPKRMFGTAEFTKTTWIDPSIRISSDIKIPRENAYGQYEWQVLYKAGEMFNPLHRFRPIQALLYFDGNQEDQLEFVAQVLKDNPLGVVPIEATGVNPDKMTERLGRATFIATDAMLERFAIPTLPSLLHPGSGAHADYMGVTAFGKPYKSTDALAVWLPKTTQANSPQKDSKNAAQTK